MVGEKSKMIKEKYLPLLLTHQIRRITTIGVTDTLPPSVRNDSAKLDTDSIIVNLKF